MKFENIMKQPFFKKESDQTNYQRLKDVQKNLDTTEIELKKKRAEIIKSEEEIQQFSQEQRQIQSDINSYTQGLNKINAYIDPSGLTVDQIRSKLEQEDPSMFRQVMRDLNFEGEEPIWEKMDMLEKIQQSDKGSGETN